MSNLTGVTNYFATAHENFADNLSGSISALATTVTVTSASEYANGDIVVLTVDPGTVNEATFVGINNLVLIGLLIVYGLRVILG